MDGAIHRAGGPAIMAELRARYPGGTPTGTAVATGAGDLPARWVIHAVGPVWRGGDHGEEELLAAAYRSAIEEAVRLGARTLTLPAISAGIYGYPLDGRPRWPSGRSPRRSAAGAPLDRVTFVLFSADTLATFERALAVLA